HRHPRIHPQLWETRKNSPIHTILRGKQKGFLVMKPKPALTKEMKTENHVRLTRNPQRIED
ncbi:hypothetical protein QUF72_03395, partial [Desulfobacterales bacterium HSG2]|nr:hypothetical protein [Desulfobacterales bacterium HSG2]